jgi:hypothetical protein
MSPGGEPQLPTEVRPTAPERRRIPHAARTPYLSAVREAWTRGRDAGEANPPALALALAVYARDGRARGVPVDVLLRALDTVVRPPVAGRARVDPSLARAWAGAELIRAYYRDD